MAHNLNELRPWETLMKKLTWLQLGDIKGKHILDFGSGLGITANHLAENNGVTSIFGEIKHYDDADIMKWCPD